MSSTKPERVTVLIVDDHDAMRAMLRAHVQSVHPDFVVLESANGTDALATCCRYRPHLILMDIGLPDIEGLELGAHLKELLPEAALIVVSQHSGQVYFERASAMGALAYVTKERIFQDLSTAIARALDIASGTGKEVTP